MFDKAFFVFTRFPSYFKGVLQTPRTKFNVNKGFLNSQDRSAALGVENEIVWVFDAMTSGWVTVNLKVITLNLDTAVGSQKSVQALGAPGKTEKCLITTEETTTFFISPCTPISYTAFLRPTAVSRIMTVEKFKNYHSAVHM